MVVELDEESFRRRNSGDLASNISRFSCDNGAMRTVSGTSIDADSSVDFLGTPLGGFVGDVGDLSSSTEGLCGTLGSG